MIRVVLIFTFLAFGLQSSAEPLEWPRRWIRVELRVSVVGLSTKDVKSLMSRELRSLGDVELTDDHPTHTITVVGSPNVSRNGEEVGFALSILVTSPTEIGFSDNDTFIDMDIDRIAKQYPEAMTAIARHSKGSVRVLHHTLVGGPINYVERQSKSAIAEIDTKIFDPARKRRQQAEKELKKRGVELKSQ